VEQIIDKGAFTQDEVLKQVRGLVVLFGEVVLEDAVGACPSELSVVSVAM
jgi:hypothetical protein|tara:strand:- start:674 stop:823 length:150 start_codon:yes stop_codon:yes gene_type:complete